MSTSSLLRIEVGPKAHQRIRDGIESAVGGQRFYPDVQAAEMMREAAAVLGSALTISQLDRLRQFGEGTRWVAALVDGLPAQSGLPATPHRGFNLDESKLAFSDMLLLGLYHLAGIVPVAFDHENFGKLFRNVAPNPDERGNRISQGYDAELGWHTDNPCSQFEPAVQADTASRSPIPRFLGFKTLRNQDRHRRPVPTEALPIDTVLKRVPANLGRALAEPRFAIVPPRSNHIDSLESVPVLESHEGQLFARYNAHPEQVRPLDSRATEALASFATALAHSEQQRLTFALQPSQILILDNYRVLHRRPSFDPGDDWSAARWLRRLFGCHSLAHGLRVDKRHAPFVWAGIREEKTCRRRPAERQRLAPRGNDARR